MKSYEVLNNEECSINPAIRKTVYTVLIQKVNRKCFWAPRTTTWVGGVILSI